MGGFQVDNEASMAPKQSRASVMSVQTNETVGGRARGRGPLQHPQGLQGFNISCLAVSL